MAPRFSASGSFAGVYGVSEIVGATIDETANYVGAVMVFQQTSAPTGWTKDTTNDDAILTATTSTITTGGSQGFFSSFNASRSVTGTVTFGAFTVGASTISQTHLPDHTHNVPTAFNSHSAGILRLGTTPRTLVTPTNLISPGAYPAPSAYAGPTSHTHPSPSTGLSTNPSTYFSRSFNLKYVDVIIATKN